MSRRFNFGLAARLAVGFVAVSGLVLMAFGWLATRRAQMVLKDELGEKLASIAEAASQDEKVRALPWAMRSGGGSIADAARAALEVIRRNWKVDNIMVAERAENGSLRMLVDARAAYRWHDNAWVLQVDASELDRVWRGQVVYSPMYAGEGGQVYLTAYAPLRIADGDVRFAVGAEASAKFLDRVRQLQTTFIRYGLIVLLFAGVLGWATARSITRPLRQLTTAAQRVEHGDYGATAEVAAAAEVGELARAFNRMSRMVNVRRELLLENMSNGLLAVEPGGAISEVNRAAEQVLGAGRDALLGRSFREALPEALAQALDETLAGDEPLHGEKVEVQDAVAGERRILQVSTSRLLDADGTPRGAELSFLDVTEVERLTDALEGQRRFAAIGEMAAEVAHQIRNPLSAVRGFADLLAADLPQEARAREYLADLLKEVRLTEGIVSSFLQLTRPSRLDLAPLALGDTVAGVVRGMRPEFEAAGVALDTHIAPDLPVIRADGKAVGQALGNLVRNALEACGAGRRVTVRAERLNGGGPAGVRVVVEDDGAGIAPDILPRLFTPFVTSKAQGTGLGLSLARKYVEAHGGTVALTGLAHGARAEIRLPLDGAEV